MLRVIDAFGARWICTKTLYLLVKQDGGFDTWHKTLFMNAGSSRVGMGHARSGTNRGNMALTNHFYS